MDGHQQISLSVFLTTKIDMKLLLLVFVLGCHPKQLLCQKCSKSTRDENKIRVDCTGAVPVKPEYIKMIEMADHVYFTNITDNGKGNIKQYVEAITNKASVVSIQATKNLNVSTIQFQSWRKGDEEIECLEICPLLYNFRAALPFMIGRDIVKKLILVAPQAKGSVSSGHMESSPLEQKAMESLQTLEIKSSGLKTMSTAALSNAISLRKLSFKDNLFKKFPRGLTTLLEKSKEMSSLDLSQNQLSHLDAGFFPEQCSLTRLNVSFNEITQIQENTFQHCRKLTVLNLEHNQIERVSQGRFMSPCPLQKFDLSSNSFDHLHPNTFAGCVNLTSLLINYHRLRRIRDVFDHFSGRNLSLELKHGQLCSFGIRNETNPSLWVVEVQNNKLVCDCALRKLLDKNEAASVFGKCTLHGKVHDLAVDESKLREIWGKEQCEKNEKCGSVDKRTTASHHNKMTTASHHNKMTTKEPRFEIETADFFYPWDLEANAADESKEAPWYRYYEDIDDHHHKPGPHTDDNRTQIIVYPKYHFSDGNHGKRTIPPEAFWILLLVVFSLCSTFTGIRGHA